MKTFFLCVALVGLGAFSSTAHADCPGGICPIQRIPPIPAGAPLVSRSIAPSLRVRLLPGALRARDRLARALAYRGSVRRLILRFGVRCVR